MAARENEYVAVHFSDSGENAIYSNSYILGRFTVGATIAEN